MNEMNGQHKTKEADAPVSPFLTTSERAALAAEMRGIGTREEEEDP
jgi:hypothetical protein